MAKNSRIKSRRIDKDEMIAIMADVLMSTPSSLESLLSSAPPIERLTSEVFLIEASAVVEVIMGDLSVFVCTVVDLAVVVVVDVVTANEECVLSDQLVLDIF